MAEADPFDTKQLRCYNWGEKDQRSRDFIATMIFEDGNNNKSKKEKKAVYVKKNEDIENVYYVKECSSCCFAILGVFATCVCYLLLIAVIVYLFIYIFNTFQN